MIGHEGIAPCKYCNKLIFFVKLKKTGNVLPVDPEILPVYHAGLVAYNEDTRQGKVLRQQDCQAENPEDDAPVVKWMRTHKITVHRAHFADRRCKKLREEKQHAARKAQEAA